MKKILISFIVFMFLFNVKATCKSEECKNALAVMKEFCGFSETDSQTNLKGCIYDSSDPLYTKSGNITNYNLLAYATAENIELTRGYQNSDENGNIVFAGCYKKYNNGEGNLSPGDQYFFKIVKLSGNKCVVTDTDVVLSKGTTGVGIFNKVADGKKGLGSDMAKYNWTATNDGECPHIFGVTANISWYTKPTNKYVFADEEDGIKNDNTKFWSFGTEPYETNISCTIDDQTNYEKEIECYDNAISEINSLACPSDLKDVTSFQENLNGLANKCAPEEKKTYSRKFLEDNSKEFRSKLKTAKNKKLNSCQFSKCNLTAAEITSLEPRIRQNGCSKLEGSEYTACISELRGILHSSGLSQTKIDCIINSQKDRDDASKQLEDVIDEDQDSHIESEIDESQDIIDKVSSDDTTATIPDNPDLDIDGNVGNCSNILGPSLTKLVKAAVRIVQIVGVIIVIVNAMISLIPAITSKDQEGLKKAVRKCIYMAIVLVLLLLLGTIIKLIGMIFGFDTSCFI